MACSEQLLFSIIDLLEDLPVLFRRLLYARPLHQGTGIVGVAEPLVATAYVPQLSSPVVERTRYTEHGSCINSCNTTVPLRRAIMPAWTWLANVPRPTRQPDAREARDKSIWQIVSRAFL